MAGSPDIPGAAGRRPRCAEDEEDLSSQDVHGVSMKVQGDMATPDIHDVGMKIQRADENYKAYGGYQDKPTKPEVFGWLLYGLCSYFIHTVLVPILFPLIISQAMHTPDPAHGWAINNKGLVCSRKGMQLYEGLTKRSITVNTMRFSPLEWTSVSWVIGLILAAPVLRTISVHLDYGQYPQLVAGAATAMGALFCLPAGFFKVTWIFPPYIAAIIIANTVGSAFHARHLGLMVRGFIGSTIRKAQFPDRRAVMSWLSLYATAIGCLGSAIMSSFTYHMVQEADNSFTSLWVVSIFSGLKWFVGIVHILSATRIGGNTSSADSVPKTHVVSIFNYPHAAGSLAGVFLSSFATMCIFTGGVLYLVGQLCFKPINVLYLWLTYFIFPLLSLPLLQPLQQLIRADAVKMQLFGFLLSTLTSGFGFYYRNAVWQKYNVLFFAAVQSTATGVLHAFGRVLLLDCSPAGKEGIFSAWFSWVRAIGTCAGFAVASAGPANISRSFGVAFCTAIVGIVVLIFGNISNFGGAVAAGHLRDRSEKNSPVHGMDQGGDAKAAHEGGAEV